MSLKTVAIIQARMGSTRLPGKILMDLYGKPMLWHVVRRTFAASTLDQVIVATTTASADDAVQEFCAQANFMCFRGDETDVLDRYYGAAQWANAQVVTRVTADCPLIEPTVIDEIVIAFQAADLDYCSNTLDRTYPDGLDVEVFSFTALERAWREAQLPSEREHVTPYLWKNPQLFRQGQVKQARDLSALRWTVDEPEDMEFARQVYAHLYEANPLFSTAEVLALLGHQPELQALNEGFESNEGYRRSVENDDQTHLTHPIPQEDAR